MIAWFIGAIMSSINKKVTRKSIEREALCECACCNAIGIELNYIDNFLSRKRNNEESKKLRNWTGKMEKLIQKYQNVCHISLRVLFFRMIDKTFTIRKKDVGKCFRIGTPVYK